MQILDRLLGRTPTAEKAVITGNGGTGPGVVAFYNDIPLWSASRNPQKLMRQAQALYHSHPWVHRAEHLVSSKGATTDWHLEDGDEDEVDDTASPQARAVQILMERPQANLGPERRQLTRRELWQVTLRHMGLCGNAFWYLDQRDQAGTPRNILYINPARMTPQYDRVANLLGWRLDASEPDSMDGVPIEIGEVLHFVLDPADWGALGIGLVESMGLKAQLSELSDRHIGNVFASGGRLTGLVSPKAEANISDEQWATFVRDWRNITDDPNAAKRLQIAKAPIDYTRIAATPTELSLESVTRMSREDIFAGWGVPLSQVGITTAAGLNSGETKGYDEAVLWQGAIHPRLVAFRETIQFGLLERYSETGVDLSLVIDEPSFDDDRPKYELAVQALSQPLRNRERRELLGLDPFGDPILDEAVWIPSSIIEIALAPDKDGKVPAKPEEPEPTPPPIFGVPPLAEDVALAAKARIDPLRGLRRSLDTRWEPVIRKSVLAVLRDQAQAIAAKVRANGAHIAAKPADTTVWWNAKAEDKRLALAIVPRSEGIAKQVAERARTTMRPGKASFEDTVATLVRTSVGDRITGINQTTREAIASLIAQGFDDGLSPAEVADLIEGATTFDEARAELIARTESTLAYNEAALRSYGEFGVTEVEAIDGDEDAECAERNGQVFPLAEALAITDHPNGTLDWAPVI